MVDSITHVDKLVVYCWNPALFYKQLYYTYSCQHAENSPYPCKGCKPFKALEKTVSTFLISFIVILETSRQFNYLCLKFPLNKINVIFCV